MASSSAADSILPPQDRDEILARAGEQKAKIYGIVRTILDDLEAVTPWDGLYYPPTGSQEFLSMETALVGMIEDIPQRVTALIRDLESAPADDPIREVIDNLEFYFQGIQVSVAPELDKLKSKLDGLKIVGGEVSAADRDFTCEISADLKGKATSSIMGAAASLIAEGLWKGVEIEPVLFPEKAEEFDRNEKLVEALSRVTEDIGNFLELVPLVDLVDSWRMQRRVDQYALAPLYSLLGNLGKLMQVTSRRALYSGDYHQIQRRETLLSARINELTSLHNTTWGTVATRVPSMAAIFPLMLRKATDMAAILDLDVLKLIIGDSAVKDLFFIVTMEREDETSGRNVGNDRKLARRSRIPEELHSLIPLLYDEDLKTFLELLLGSVLKRASLTVKREPLAETSLVAAVPAMTTEDSAATVPPVALELALEPPELAQVDPGDQAASPTPAAPPAIDEADQIESLGRLLAVLQPLLSRTSSARKSFELVRRLLKQKRTIPAGLLESMRPYLYEVMNQLIPQLRDDSRLGDMYSSYGTGLFERCQTLCDPNLSPESREVDVPGTMESVLDLLNRLAIATRSSLEKLSGEPKTMAGADPLAP